MRGKRFLLYVMGIAVAFICILASFDSGKNAYAADAMITLSSERESVDIGEVANVRLRIDAISNVGMVDLYLEYDASRLEYIPGAGGSFQGGAGLLHIASDESASASNSLSYTLSFKVIASGTANINFSNEKKVTDTVGKEMTTSSNRISILATGNVNPSVPGQPAATVELSDDNNLLSLSVSAGELKPTFKSKKTNYSVEVTNDVKEIYFSFKASDPKAVVRFEGNEMLFDGKNEVKVIVTAPSGSEKVYNIDVYRESLAESKKRVAESGKKGLDFKVYEDGGTVYLQNKYRLAIVDVDESEEAPAGFTKTSVLLYGINVTAYTVSSDLDSEYLLMYCMNENGEKDFYQFDRTDNTLQRYTGDLIKRINANKDNMPSDEIVTSEQYKENLNQLAVIIAILVGACVLLIIVIISVLLKLAKAKSHKIEDELDF